MNKKLLVTVISIGVIGLAGVGMASAHGMFGFGSDLTPEEFAVKMEARFENQAEILDTNVDTVKNAWSEGKNISELAEELGIDESTLQTRMQERHEQMMREKMQSLVDQEVITQEQADQKIKYMEENGFQGKGFGKGMGHHGSGGFGF